MDAVHAEIQHLLKESNIRCFRKHFNVIVLDAVYVHGAEVFAKMKYFHLGSKIIGSELSFNKCTFFALTAPIYVGWDLSS